MFFKYLCFFLLGSLLFFTNVAGFGVVFQMISGGNTIALLVGVLGGLALVTGDILFAAGVSKQVLKDTKDVLHEE